MLPMKSLTVVWPLPIILTNRSPFILSAALSALIHLLPFWYSHLEGRDDLLVRQSVFTTASPSLTRISKGHCKTNTDIPHSFSIKLRLNSLPEPWCCSASETPKVATVFCWSWTDLYIEGHRALQQRSLLKMHAVKSGLQSRSVQFSSVLGNVASPSSANDSCKSFSPRRCLLCTKCCHYL